MSINCFQIKSSVGWGKFELVIRKKYLLSYVIILYRHLEENKVSI